MATCQHVCELYHQIQGPSIWSCLPASRKHSSSQRTMCEAEIILDQDRACSASSSLMPKGPRGTGLHRFLYPLNYRVFSKKSKSRITLRCAISFSRVCLNALPSIKNNSAIIPSCLSVAHPGCAPAAGPQIAELRHQLLLIRKPLP